MIRKTLPVEVLSEETAKEFFSKAVKVVDCNLKDAAVDENRTMYIKISTNTKDRSGDIVEPSGVILDNYINNNIVAAFHKYDEPSVGRTIQFAIGHKDIVVKMEFPPKGVYAKADLLHDLYKAKFQHAASIGFSSNDFDKLPDGGYHFKTWELYEYSLVLIPDNPEALAKVKSAGFDPKELLEEQTKNLEQHEEKEKVEAIEEKKISEMTVKELMDQTRSINVEKGVREVVALAYLASDLDFYIWAFEQNGVKEETINKLKTSLSSLMEAIKDQAELEETITETKGLIIKAGRTLSAKNEGLIKTAHENLSKVLETLGNEEEDKKEVKTEEAPITVETLLAVQKGLRKTDKEVGLTLHSINAYLKDKENPIQKEG